MNPNHRTSAIPSAIHCAAMALACALLPTAAMALEPTRDERTADLAVFGDAQQRADAIAQLRAAGPAGLKILAARHAGLLASLRAPAFPRIPLPTTFNWPANWPATSNPMPQSHAAESAVPPTVTPQARLKEALDQVARQRGAADSMLYWYTDLAAAQQSARQLNRPILSLRLLGKLTDEYSCANSRFFRTVLYANREVSDALRERFVLHWSTERPVPIVTVDFGDGRKLKSTITGNSAHYVLDCNGRPVDVIPGLYGPKAFLRVLADAGPLADRVASLSDAQARTALRDYHAEQLSRTLRGWSAGLLHISGAERGLPAQFAALDAGTSDAEWDQLATLDAADAELDDASRQLIRAEQPLAPAAMARTMSKAKVEDPLLRLVLNLQRNVAKDTVRNEYRLHAMAHQWFATGQPVHTFAVLNNRVYAELFLTPASDPWMGLAPNEYTGLEGSGIASK